jgi:hypothetical protein
MKKAKRWQDKLTKKELKHLAETCFGRPTLAALKRNREGHRETKAKTGVEPCYDCRHIALKLEVE